MTGSRFSFRGSTSCNLHVRPLPSYSPQFSKEKRERTWLEKLARYKLHVPAEHASPGRGGRDAHGDWVWMNADCLWEWAAGRPFHNTPLARPFYLLHDHVHEKHDHPRRTYVFAPAQIALVQALEKLDSILDAIPTVSLRPLKVYRHGGFGCRLGLAELSTRLDEHWMTDVWKRAHGYRISVTFSELTDLQIEKLRDEVHDETFRTEPARPGYAPYGERTPRTKVTWVEWASNPALARDQAQALVIPLELGGSFWDTPVRIDP